MESSWLNDIPGELRNRIYELALLHPGGAVIDGVIAGGSIIVNGEGTPTRPQPKSPAIATTMALLSTCRQIRDEASSVFFEINHFEITSPHRLGGTKREWEGFKRQIGTRNANGLRQITFVKCIPSGTYPIGHKKEGLVKYIKTVLQASKEHPNCKFRASVEVPTWTCPEYPWGTWPGYSVTLDMSSLENSYGEALESIYERVQNRWSDPVVLQRGAERMEDLFAGAWKFIKPLLDKSEAGKST